MRLAYFGWFLGALFFFFAWILRVSPSVMVEELMRDFGVGGAALGQLSALYFYGYAGMQVPVGVLLDRFGPRRLMTGAAAVCGTGCLMFAMSAGLGVASAGRFLIGAGAAFSLVGSIAVAGQWLPPRRFALFSGFAMMMGMAGGVFGQAPLRLAVEASGWRMTIGALTVAAFGLALGIWLTVRDRRRGAGDVGSMLAGLRVVASSRQTWLTALAGLGGTGPLLAFAALWGVPYLQAAYGIDRAAAGAVTSLAFVGTGIGSPLFGALSDWFGKRRPPLLAGIGVSGVSLAAILYLPGLPLAGAAVLCFLVGLGGAALVICFAIARDQNPSRLTGTAIGLVNGCVTGAGALFQPLVGWILDASWDGQMNAGARIYTVGDYQIALGALVIGCALSALCVLGLREGRASRG